MAKINMMNKDHKSTNESYRKGYDDIRWDNQKKDTKKKNDTKK